MRNGRNRRRRWYERRRNERVKNLGLFFIVAATTLVVVLLFYTGMYTPVVYVSETGDIVRVEDRRGCVVTNKVAEDKILAGTYETVWVK